MQGRDHGASQHTHPNNSHTIMCCNLPLSIVSLFILNALIKMVTHPHQSAVKNNLGDIFTPKKSNQHDMKEGLKNSACYCYFILFSI